MHQHGLPELLDDVKTWVAALKAAGCRPRPEGAGFRASCPGPNHANGNRKNPALSVRQGDGGRVLVSGHAGCCSFEEIRAALDIGTPRDVAPAPRRHMQRARPAPQPVNVQRWDFLDESGASTVTVCREDLNFGPKRIWREPAGRKPPAGGWPPLGLANLLAHPNRQVLIVEGETTFDQAGHLVGDRMAVITTLGGAGKARQTNMSYFEGRTVATWPDNDDPGYRHAQDLATLCREAGALEVLTVRREDLAGCPPGWDLADTPPAGFDIEAVLENAVSVRSLYNPRTAKQHFFTPLSELLDEPMPGVNWLVSDILPAGGTGLIVGPPKAGKLSIGRNLVVAVAEGRDYFGRDVQQGPAIYATFEGRRRGVIEHFQCMEPDRDAPLSVYHGAAFEPDEAIAILEGEIVKAGAVLVVIDTLLRLLRLTDAKYRTPCRRSLTLPSARVARWSRSTIPASPAAKTGRKRPGPRCCSDRSIPS